MRCAVHSESLGLRPLCLLSLKTALLSAVAENCLACRTVLRVCYRRRTTRHAQALSAAWLCKSLC